MSSSYTNSYLFLNKGFANFNYQSPTFKDLGNPIVHVSLGGSVIVNNITIYKSKRIWKKDDTVFIELPAQFLCDGFLYDLNDKGDNIIEITKNFGRSHKVK
jgi:hypothetical protein